MSYKDPEQRKAYNALYRAKNRAEAYARVKAWKKANPEKVAEQNKKYAAKHPDILREKALRYKRRNLDAVRAAGRKSAAKARAEKRDIISLRKKEYRVRRKDVVNAAVARRKAAKLKRTPAWLTLDDFWLIGQAYELAALRTEMLGFSWHVDHVIPLQGTLVSGLHVPSNLQVIPGVENTRKKNLYEVR